ncbi:hypothetical protein APHAL10511_006895 [Amanita phalloides]|nr:hypothetical protein APHAL10511_006895 [Amanita phalloides]
MDGKGDAVAEWRVCESGSRETRVEDQILPPSRKGERHVDEFLGDDLAKEEENGDASPPSKMRSDYIAEDGRTVIGSADGAGLVERIRPRLPRRTRTSAVEEEPGSRRRGYSGR